MDINKELSKLFLKYKTFEQESELMLLYKHIFCELLFNKMISKIPSDNVIALRGAGNVSRILMKYLSDENKKKISYVIDWNRNQKIEGVETITPKEISLYGIQTIIIGSYNYRFQFKSELLSTVECEKLLDPFDYFAYHGVYCNGDFGTDVAEYKHITYFDLNIALYYANSAAKKRKKRILLKAGNSIFIRNKRFCQSRKVCVIICRGRI